MILVIDSDNARSSKYDRVCGTQHSLEELRWPRHKKLIPYYRVSTKKQGESGLGLDGQEAAVAAFQLAFGGEVLKSYQEVETGKIAERPELQKAIAHAKRSKATLVVAKLDRLARNVEFTAKLMNSGVEFVACDNPHANRLTIHILAAVAEDEAKRISERTSGRPEPRSSRTSGCRSGSRSSTPRACRPRSWRPRPGSSGRRSGRSRPTGPWSVRPRPPRSVRPTAREAYADLAPLVPELRSSGLSLRQIVAPASTRRGTRPGHGKPWNPMQVSRAPGRLTS